ncbi:MAG TPA: alpha/beta fold hydrolase [Chloroflexota bacterium]|nr:alpha/beta fold hydrolase [Chloroflexota bacterium]
MPAIPIGTIQMYYESHGKGQPLVLLPDMGNDVTSLWSQVPRLSQDFRCIAIDNRGVGRSSKPSTQYTMKLLADDVIHVLDHLRIPRAHVFGISMGGAIAQEMAINHPERVGALVMVASWARPDRYLSCLLELFKDVKRSVDPLTFERQVALWSFTRGYFDTSYDELEKRQRASLDVPYPTPSVTFTRQVEACMAHDACDRLGQITAPTLNIAGEEDIFTPLPFSRELTEMIPNANLEVVPGSAHAVHWEKPDEVNQLTIDHLTNAGIALEPIDTPIPV